MSSASSAPLSFDQVARIPEPNDNVAIACQTLPAGTKITRGEQVFLLPHTVLEGHRFALTRIAEGASLLSWSLPFGRATKPIEPGDYICNPKILSSLKGRHVPFELPAQGNFEDHHQRYELTASDFSPGVQVNRYEHPATFQGYLRSGGRGIGTRNYIVVLGTTSLTGSYARAVAGAFKGVSNPNFDGVVPVAHTEGGEPLSPNNFQWTLRTLAGFMTNPNVGAVLALDFGNEVITNAKLRAYLEEHNYPLAHLTHRFMSVQGDFASAVREANKIVQAWIEPVSQCRRTPQPLEGLRLGLQCGGSDAFSGISGNPVVGIMSRELVRHGGSANLAETDELVGAEPYILRNVRNYETAQSFLATLDRFQERVSWHKDSAEGNPSGGNNYRGLYNIAIKSIGAALKKDPTVRLDYVIEYGQPMTDPGFYFMDSPGNDLESIAGQVASGCNLIVFTTGNGSITNFPFVPTIKIMTTTARFNLLSRDMDINAGEYLDGKPMEQLGLESFDYMMKIASGQKSVGEAGGHSQVQLWREWRQTSPNRPAPRAQPKGKPLLTATDIPGEVPSPVMFEAVRNSTRSSTEQVGLIIPTSLCSGQIGRMLAERLNASGVHGLSRFVSLSHTEGCGVSSGECETLYLRTMAGYLVHPMTASALLLEHGCEKTHNDAMRNYLTDDGVELGKVGWASIQLDGGIEKVTTKVLQWFDQQPRKAGTNRESQPLSGVKISLTSLGQLPPPVAEAFAQLSKIFLKWGGTSILPSNASFWKNPAFLKTLGLGELPAPTLGYGQRTSERGLHVMDSPSEHAVETLTGLGGTGVELVLAWTETRPLQSHPLIPVIQVGANEAPLPEWKRDLDLLIEADASPAAIADQFLGILAEVASRTKIPKLFQHGNCDFQLTRGRFGVSL